MLVGENLQQQQLEDLKLEMADNGRDYSGQDRNGPRSPLGTIQGLQLTDEEIKVLKECRTNSFYLRGIPAGVLSLIATRYAGNNYFPHIKRWPGFYYTGALLAGMVAGIASYRHKCVEKIMSLDDSRLADQIRKYQQSISGQGGKIGSEFECDRDFTSQQQQSKTRPPLSQSPQGQDHRSFRGSYHTNDTQDDEENQLPSTSYADLRKRSRESRMQGPKRLTRQPQREEENTVQNDIYDPDTTYDRRETYSPGSAWESSAPQASYEEKSKPQLQQWPQAEPDHRRRNKYGDEME